MKKLLKIIFMGTSAFAVPSLKALIEKGEDVVWIVTQPDRPKGRGREVQQSPVKEVALARHIPLFQPQSVKDAESIAYLSNFSPDLFVVVALARSSPVRSWIFRPMVQSMSMPPFCPDTGVQHPSTGHWSTERRWQVLPPCCSMKAWIRDRSSCRDH